MENFSFTWAILTSVCVLVFTCALSQFRSNPLFVAVALSAILLGWFLDADFPVSFLGMQRHVRVFVALWIWWIFESFVFASTGIVLGSESIGAVTSVAAVVVSFVCLATLTKYPEVCKAIVCGALAMQTFSPTPDRVFFLESVALSMLKAALLTSGYIALCHAILSNKLENASRATDIYFVSHFWIAFSHAYVLAAYPLVAAGVYFYHSEKDKSPPPPPPPDEKVVEDSLLEQALQEAKRKQLDKHPL